MIEETPRLLDPEIDWATLEMFDQSIEINAFTEITLPTSIALDIIKNAINLCEQFVTH